MADRINLLKRMEDVNISPQFDGISKVVIHVSDDAEIVAGDDYGRTFEITNPFGTQAMAQQLLAKLRGFQYQPGRATGALLDPAAEMGDGISANGVYFGLYNRQRDFNHLMTADIAAPHEEEINHEYKFESPQERKFARQLDNVRADMLIQADQILAQVVKQQDGATSSFGWTLTSSGWNVYANGTPVLTVNRNGLEVAGTIKAGAKIGSGSGFTISAKAIYNNISSMSGTQSSGVYLGTDGIKLGQNFSVTSSGVVTAKKITADSMTLTGTLTIAGTRITADNLRKGAERANSGYTNWNNAYNSACSSNGYCYSGVADWKNAQTYGSNCDYFKANTLNASDTFIYRGAAASWKWVSSLSCFVLATYGEG